MGVALRREKVPVWVWFAPWVVGIAALCSGYATGKGVSDFNVTHWLFTYDLEFTRRALVGTLLWGLVEPDPALVRGLGVALLVVCSAALILFVSWALRRRPVAFGVGFMVLTAACPATLAQFGYDCGRFDQLNLLLFLAALVLIVRGTVAAPLGVALLTVIALLIHEAFVFTHVPVLMGLMIHGSGGRVTRGLVLVAVVALIVTALVIWFGSLEAVDHETYRNQLVERYDLSERSVYLSSRVLYRELPDNIALATGTLSRRLLNWQSLAILAALTPWLWVVLGTLRSLHTGIGSGHRRGYWLPVIVAASPLLLVVVSTDLFRWVSLSMLNLLVVTLVLVRIHPEADIRFHLSWKSLTVLVGLGLLAGPLGVERPFPHSRLIWPFHLGPAGALEQRITVLNNPLYHRQTRSADPPIEASTL